MPDELCCRCGNGPRVDGSLICASCRDDPRARDEIDTLWRSGLTAAVQRRVAVRRYGWVGGWPRLPRDERVSR